MEIIINPATGQVQFNVYQAGSLQSQGFIQTASNGDITETQIGQASVGFHISGTIGSGSVTVTNDGNDTLVTTSLTPAQSVSLNFGSLASNPPTIVSGSSGQPVVLINTAEGSSYTVGLMSTNGATALVITRTSPSGMVSSATFTSGQAQIFNELGTVGSLAGGDLALLLAGNSRLENLATTTFFSTASQLLLQEIYVNHAFNANISASYAEGAFVGSFTEAAGGYIFGEAGSALFKAIGINPAVGEVLGSTLGGAVAEAAYAEIAPSLGLTTTASTNFLSNVDPYSAAVNIFEAATGLSPDVNLFGGNPQDVQIGGEIGGLIGTIASFGIPVVGSVIGQFVGSIVGSLFGPPVSVGPNAENLIGISTDPTAPGFVVAYQGSDNDAPASLISAVNGLGSLIASTLNAEISATGGNVSSISDEISVRIFKNQFYDAVSPSDGSSNFPNVTARAFASDYNAVLNDAVIRQLALTTITGGDAYITGILHNSLMAYDPNYVADALSANPETETIADLNYDLQAGEDYQAYQANPQAFILGFALRDPANAISDWPAEQALLARGALLQRIYVYQPGQGSITIDNYSSTNTSGNEGLIIFQGLTGTNALVEARDGNDLVIGDGIAGDAVVVQDAYESPNYMIGGVETDDTVQPNATWSQADIPSLPVGATPEPVPSNVSHAGMASPASSTRQDGDPTEPPQPVMYQYDGSVVDLTGETAILTVGAGSEASDIYLQANDSDGSLIVSSLADPADATKFENALSDNDGIQSQLQDIELGDGTSIELTNNFSDLGSTKANPLVFTYYASPQNTTLVGSGYGANIFYLASGEDTVTFGNGSLGGSTQNLVVFSKGDGGATVNTGGGVGTLELDGDISLSDVIFTGGGDDGSLTIALRSDLSDTVTFTNDLTQIGGLIESQLETINLSNGSAIQISAGALDAPLIALPLTFTFVGTIHQTNLVGSGWGANTFDLASGGDHVTFGNGDHAGSNLNTILFDVGDGNVQVDPNGGLGILKVGYSTSSGLLVQRPDIAASDILFEGGGTDGSLTIALRSDPSDTVTFIGDLTSTAGVVESQLEEIDLGDGSVIQVDDEVTDLASIPFQYYLFAKPLTFTSIGTSYVKDLVGSDWGANVFDLGVGGDTITFGNGSNVGFASSQGANKNTVMFDRGDGNVTVNLNGGIGTLQFAADIQASDVYLQTDSADDLIVKLLNDPADSLTVVADFSSFITFGFLGFSNPIDQINFGGGNVLSIQQPYMLQRDLVFTWIGASTSTTLTGSDFGSNLFRLAPGDDTVNFGNLFYLDYLNASTNTVLFERGDGTVTVNPDGGFGTLEFGADIKASDLVIRSDSAGDLIVGLQDSPTDSITVVNNYAGDSSGSRSFITGLKLDDGESFNYVQLIRAFNTFDGTAGSDALYGTAGPDVFDGKGAPAGSQDYEQGNGGGGGIDASDQGYEDGDIFIFNAGYGHLEIREDDYSSSNPSNTLQFGAGVEAANVTVTGESDGTIVLTDGVVGDQIQLDDELASSNHGVQQIQFADGTVWTQAYVIQLSKAIEGTTGADTLYGPTFGDTFDGKGAPTGSEDYEQGQDGGNTFVYDRGYGQLEINDLKQGNSPPNTLQFGADIMPSDITVTGDGDNDIFLTDGTSGDRIILDEESADFGGVFIGQSGIFSAGVQQVQFADGTTWTHDQLLQLLQEAQPTRGADVLVSLSPGQTFDGEGAPAGSQDYEQGLGGGDTFIYNQGYGQLEINESDYDGTPHNVLQLGVGITSSNITVTADQAGNVFLTDGADGDRIQLDYQLYGGAWGVQQVEFADGTTWTDTDLQLKAGWIIGTFGADTLSGSAGAEIFDGRGAPAGSQDHEEGGGGADTFIYDQGYGQLEISENGNYWNNADVTLQLGYGLTQSDLSVTSDGSGNIYLTDGTPGDQIKLDGELNYGGLGQETNVTTVSFADGSTLSSDQLIQLALTGTPNNTSLHGTPGADIIDGKGYATYADGGGGADTFIYDQGCGQLEISENANYWTNTPATLQLGAGITQADLVVTSDGSGNVYLTDGVTGDEIKLDGELSYGGLGQETTIGTIDFADGTSLSGAQLITLATTGSPTNTSLHGSSGIDVIDGKGYATYADGGGGADTFIYDQGYGQFEISEGANYWSYTTATLQLGPGITRADLGVSSDASGNLYLTDGTAGDQIKLDGELGYGGYGQESTIGTVTFADGSSLTSAQLITLATTGSPINTNLNGTPGADIIDSRGYATTADGGGGADTFIYDQGYGQLEISENANYWSYTTATLQLGPGITRANLGVSSDASGNLYLTDGTAGDQIKLDGELSYGGFGQESTIGTVTFADGSSLTRAQLIALATTGTPSNTILYGTPGADVIDSGGYATYADGKAGADTFLYNQGYGQLEIAEGQNYWNNASAILQLGPGITQASLTVTTDGSGDAILTDGIAGDRIQLDGEISPGGDGQETNIATVSFADGSTLSSADLIRLAAARPDAAHSQLDVASDSHVLLGSAPSASDQAGSAMRFIHRLQQASPKAPDLADAVRAAVKTPMQDPSGAGTLLSRSVFDTASSMTADPHEVAVRAMGGYDLPKANGNGGSPVGATSSHDWSNSSHPAMSLFPT